MHLFYCDETNTNPNASEFFIYGGVSIPAETARALSKKIDEIRAEFGFAGSSELKFDTRSRPDNVNAGQHLEAKRQVMEAARQANAKLFSSLINHGIARDTDRAQRLEINRACLHFQLFLEDQEDAGLALFDTFGETAMRPILTEKFHVGLTGLPHRDPYRLDRIVGFHIASMGTSNLCSVVDIVLGAMRFAVNAASRDEERPRQVAGTLLEQLRPLCLATPDNRVSMRSLFYSPRTVKVPRFAERYGALSRFLADRGFPVEASVTVQEA